jgi:hypothetical protein
VGFARDEDVLEAFTTDAPQQSLADRVCSRGLARRAQHLNATSRRDSLEVPAVPRIIVMDQILRRLPKWRRFPQLPRNPRIRR